ncbi:MAG: hypothetical protein HRT94_06080 [Alphaproteobacteria bacterium]|nr:hypothetical protein [Alphaproteobacteria bacterium]
MKNVTKALIDKKFITFAVMITALVGIVMQSHAKPATDGILLITEKNQTMSKLLENRGAMQDTITFLHEHISETAVFDMSMSNETMPEGAPQQSIQMSKADYINSFIQGTHFVDDYKVSIKTVDVQVSNDPTIAISKEVMTEEGVSLNPYNLREEGKPFVSTTNCTTTHKIDGDKAIAVKAECHTNTSFLTGV